MIAERFYRGLSADTQRVASRVVAGVLGTAVFVGSVTLAARASDRSVRPIDHDVRARLVQTGWTTAADKSRTKVVPFVTIALDNLTGERLSGVSLTAVFRRTDEKLGWGDAYLPHVDDEHLAPRSPSAPLVLKSPFGYTGDEPPPSLLQHSRFVDVRVTVLAKRGSAQWQRLGEWPVERQLAEQR